MTKLTANEIIAIDQAHIWHPYSAYPSTQPIFPVESAQGVVIKLTTGEQLIDGMSSWWSTIHGYNHPYLNDALKHQIESMSHVMFGGFTHEPAARLAKTLVDITPQGLDKVFFSDSGSVAVEVAMKMALQYWQSQGITTKTKLLSLKNGYHGDTFGAMSVCDPVTGMHHIFSDALTQQIFADAPNCRFDEPLHEAHLSNIRHQIKQHHHQLAAVVLEPIVQGAGGMRFYSADYLKEVRALCDDYQLLLIADEIATGFGRTGKLFACEHAKISPDILCLGKALTGGYMTLAATLCTEKVAKTICQGEAGVFMHGPTFMGNPLACAVANASIELLLKTNWQTNVKRIEQFLLEHLTQCRQLKAVSDVRVLGAIGVVELHNAVDMYHIQPLFVKHGIWLRPFGKLVYMMPAFIMSDEQLSILCSQTFEVLKKLND